MSRVSQALHALPASLKVEDGTDLQEFSLPEEFHRNSCAKGQWLQFQKDASARPDGVVSRWRDPSWERPVGL